MLVLPQHTPNDFLGVKFNWDTKFEGGYHVPDWKETNGVSVSDLRYRSTYPTLLVASGCDEIGANGLLGRKKFGKGTVIFSQLDTDRFNADSLTYFRFTRWRQTRALSQLLANMRASFHIDKTFFEQQKTLSYAVSLDGKWKAQMTQPLASAKDVKDKYKDPGISATALALVGEEADESKMIEIPAGVEFEKANREWSGFDGEIVYRKTIELPSNMTGEDLVMNLSSVDDYDEVYLNGVLVAKTGIEKEPVWSYRRSYTIPAKFFKDGKNVIAIRIFDTYGGGGLMPTSQKREIVPKLKKNIPTLYHTDYIDDFEMGDDPFRYFRW